MSRIIGRIRHFLAWLCPPYRRWRLRHHKGGPAPFVGPQGRHW